MKRRIIADVRKCDGLSAISQDSPGKVVYTVSLSEKLERRDDVITQQNIQVLDGRKILKRELWKKVATEVETLERRTGTCDDVKHVSVKRELKED